jgi:hypothetical protein
MTRSTTLVPRWRAARIRSHALARAIAQNPIRLIALKSPLVGVKLRMAGSVASRYDGPARCSRWRDRRCATRAAGR